MTRSFVVAASALLLTAPAAAQIGEPARPLPERFHGTWADSQATCDIPTNDGRVEINATTVLGGQVVTMRELSENVAEITTMTRDENGIRENDYVLVLNGDRSLMLVSAATRGGRLFVNTYVRCT